MILALLVLPGIAHANHSVLVEGQADFDGDGLLGTAEDTDGDFVFGTLNGGVNGVGMNGSVTVVTSGIFPEALELAPSGTLVVQAAPGVIAVIEAFMPPGNDPANTTRQNMPGVVVTTANGTGSDDDAGIGGGVADRAHGGTDDGSRTVLLRNLHIRNWSVGVESRGDARVTVDNCVLDSNVDYGIHATDDSSMTVSNSVVTATGRRTTPAPNLDPASPGAGITVSGFAFMDVFNTVVTSSIGAGFANASEDGALTRLRVNDIVSADNNPGANYINFLPARYDRPTQTPPLP